MKRIDYYAAAQPWKVPKWMGVTLGAIFSAVAVMAVALIVQLSQPAHADTPPPMAKVEVPTPSEPAPVVTEAPVQPQAVAPARPHVIKHAKLHSKKTRTVKSSTAKSRAILARHDSREKRKQRDDLDRLLGL